MMKKIIASLILVLALLFSTIGATVAWFIDGYSFSPEPSGGIMGGYFAGGDGTSAANAYVLNKKEHLLNLAWLQYIGYFGDEPTYFKLNEDLKFSESDNVVIPPIGTFEHPFIGVFDGGEHIISGVKVCNFMGSGGVSEDDRPHSVSDLSGAPIIGFFGVVGDPTTAETEADVVPTVKDLILDNITVISHTDETLIGLVAGYVNGGSIQNVGVSYSSIVIGAQTKALSEATITSLGLANITASNAVSHYSLIGACSTTGGELSDPNSGTGEGEGAGSGFGASIDMPLLARRLTYMIYANEEREADYSILYNNPDFSYTNTDDSVGFWSNTDTGEITVIPLSVDTDTMFTINDSLSTTYPAHYYNGSPELVFDGNIGYIVGDKAATGTTIDISSISSISATVGSESKDTYVIDDLKIYTVVDGTMYQINKDGSLSGDTTGFKLKKYTTVVPKFAASLSNSITSIKFASMYMMGILFYGIVYDSNTKTVHYTTSTMTNAVVDDGAPSTDGNGNITTTHSSYQLVNGGINFSVKATGDEKYITTIAGSYSDTKSLPFRLYQITRNANKEITAVEAINTVWVNDDGDVQYNLTSGAYNGDTTYKKRYDADNITFDNENAAYYMEIPVKDENCDYVLSGYGGNSGTSPYLLYLDVGASAEAATGPDAAPNPINAIEGVDFVPYSATVADIKNITDYQSSAAYRINVSTPGEFEISFSRTDMGADPAKTVVSGSHTVTEYYKATAK